MANDGRKRRRRRRRNPAIAVGARRELTNPWIDGLGGIFGRWVQNPDRTLEDHSSEGLRLYSEILRKDAQLALCFRQRALNVMAQGWRIIPGGDSSEDMERASWVEGVFKGINRFHISRTLFFRGISHGFAPAEIIFARRGDGTIGIDSFRNRDPERFRFDPEGNLLLADMPGEPRQLPGWKFVLNSWGGDETPYGQGLLRELYPLWFFKNNAVKQLVRFVEKFGSPYLWAGYPPGTSTAEQDALLEVLKTMQSNTVGIGPQGTEFQISEVARQGVVDVFRFIIGEYVDRQYAKAILGQTLSTESESGTHALAKFQRESLQHIIEDDSQWQQEQLDGVIRTLIEINFGPLPAERYPTFRIAYEEDRDLAAYLGAVGKAVNELGLKVGENWLREQIGFTAPRGDDTPLAGKDHNSKTEKENQ
jgi:phage gp29-like protein